MASASSLQGQVPARPVRLLAIESATAQCSAALLLDGQWVQQVAPVGARNSEVLLPMVQSLLAGAGVTLGSLDAIAFGAGPGAFTGLRVACGVAQGLALGSGLPVIPVGTLEVVAETFLPWAGPGAAPERVLAGLDARMQEAYWAELTRRGNGDWQVEMGPLLAAPQGLPLPPGQGWIGVGDAFAVFAEALQQRLGACCSSAPEHAGLPDAAALARLAALRWFDGAAIDPGQAQPLYVRDKVALTSRERGGA
ncbi:MAG: tRNA (adenosine(37)-N6)-threonylcarbamoyltransferase complex dimerization subunit type 1 TsaB [Pseudomonadota bacterium]|nr:tRNA (adenosine(37)-N6)-threonylcarbamoyltransferase complex dimerization subunit type 1 TsaB [Pseudomonadota bacterium]